MKKLVGRHREIAIFKKVFISQQSEFVAVYGRRRIGKTFLIQNCCKDAVVYFELTGIKDGTLKTQLHNFITVFQKCFYPEMSGEVMNIPANWHEAFTLLTGHISKLPATSNIVLFFDELPWLAGKKSSFMQYLDHFWNSYWNKLSHLKLIVCGSAASWMLNNLINAKGGLHNRITFPLLLKPFTLAETKEFLVNKGMSLQDKQILDLYMVMGGVPYYLNYINKSKSVAQNINDICVAENGVLYSEFPRLFRSLFDATELNLSIMEEISKTPYGVSFLALTEKLGKKAGGRFKERLDELEATGFIKKFLPYGRTKRDHFYRIIDEYSAFYLKWIKPALFTNVRSDIMKSPSWYSWSGRIFEMICVKHVGNILAALQLTNAGCKVSNWSHVGKALEMNGAEIDMLIDREDDAISLCEIKHSAEPFIVDKSVAKNLMQKHDVFLKVTKTKKQLFTVLIASAGVKPSPWVDEMIDHIVDLEVLYRS